MLLYIGRPNYIWNGGTPFQPITQFSRVLMAQLIHDSLANLCFCQGYVLCLEKSYFAMHLSYQCFVKVCKTFFEKLTFGKVLLFPFLGLINCQLVVWPKGFELSDQIGFRACSLMSYTLPINMKQGPSCYFGCFSWLFYL